MKEYEAKAQADKQRHLNQVAELLENKGWWADEDGFIFKQVPTVLQPDTVPETHKQLSLAVHLS